MLWQQCQQLHYQAEQRQAAAALEEAKTFAKSISATSKPPQKHFANIQIFDLIRIYHLFIAHLKLNEAQINVSFFFFEFQTKIWCNVLLLFKDRWRGMQQQKLQKIIFVNVYAVRLMDFCLKNKPKKHKINGTNPQTIVFQQTKRLCTIIVDG